MAAPQKKRKKCLIVDTSAAYPIAFAEKNLNLYSGFLEDFVDNLDLELFSSDKSAQEFSFSYGTQRSIFTSPIEPTVFLNVSSKGFSVSLSGDGYFSVSNGNAWEQFNIGITQIDDISAQTRLWELSPHWGFLSPQDKSLVTLAYEKSKTFNEVAVLTNDWHLRQQLLDFENISTFGSSSMLAGVVLTGFISYQKGTYVYLGWLKENPRWIPYTKNSYGVKRKLKFSEVLSIERSRIENGSSFWSP